ncbi:MAG TPA: DUF4129 domain-containing protein [Candidatus Yaniella excrementigallinarum]|nr:DUF4129 domain-containing protein [Candidatus Yaniella excrementigallinarum]
MSPWTPDDDEARRLLDERIDSYDVDDAISIWDRFLRWLDDALGVNVDASGTGGVVIQILLVLAVGVVIFVLIRYFRPSVSPDAVDDDEHLVDPTVSAEQYFAQAQSYLEAGQLDQAYIHAYRFMVRLAQQRKLVDVTPSTTATSFGWSLGAVLPGHREDIYAASSQFNQIVYGGSTPSRDAVTAMLHLAQATQNAQPQTPDPQMDPARLIPR